jgi:GNAT superfamily N-acetyltransferase
VAPEEQPLQEHPLEIRLAERRDLPTILQMLARDSVSEPSRPDGPAEMYLPAFEAIASHPDNELVVAMLNGEIVGTLQLTFIPGLSFQGAWRAQVEGVRVRADVRNQRIGTRLMEWVIERARERNCKLIQLTTNKVRVDAQRFYQRLGFTPSHVGMKLHIS